MKLFKKRHKVSPAKEESHLPYHSSETKDFSKLMDLFKSSSDFITFPFPEHGGYAISYFKSMVSPDQVHQDVLPNLTNQPKNKLDQIKGNFPVENIVHTSDTQEIKKLAMSGSVIIQFEPNSEECLMIPCVSTEKRQISVPDIEYSVMGPKEAFVESVEVNINLVRKRLPLPELTTKEFRVGRISQTRIVILYIDGIVNKEDVQTVSQRIHDIDFDSIIDISFITQMITDNKNSVFPQFIETERPDRLAGVLTEGKIGIMMDGAPQVLIVPNTIISFFSAAEDYFMPWILGSVFRLLRVFAILFSIFSTSVYVAVITYHYEVIPTDLLPTLISSRGVVPFPPVLETLILEGTIELLREASVRLPTKVGATVGTVGGIVIGTAAVQAGFVSNVLLIFIALAALASFTTPIYQIGNTIRFIRFPFLLAAQLYGLLGIAICSAFLLSHLLKLTSLGRPYLEPLYPLRIRDFKDSFFRLPFSMQPKRPQFLFTENATRFQSRLKKEKMDIDE